MLATMIFSKKDFFKTLRLFFLAGMAVIFSVAARAENTGSLSSLSPFYYAAAISGDGHTIIGYTPDFVATRLRDNVSTTIATFPPYIILNGVSYDGNVVVGSSGGTNAFRWTEAGGITILPPISGDSDASANGVSANGNIIVGYSVSSSFASIRKAVRWVDGNVSLLSGLPGYSSSSATGVSADGNVIVGWGDSHAFRWTPQSGWAELTSLTTAYSSAANAVSSDGQYAAGYSQASNGQRHAVLWNGSTPTDLGVMGGTASIANDVSSNGTVVVGNAYPGNYTTRAFRWTQVTGMQDLNTLLSNAGVNMTGITLTTANGVSDNGLYIAANSENQAYLVLYSDDSTAGITSRAAQQAATQDLADRQNNMLVQQRTLANALLGANRPVNRQTSLSADGIYGSLEGLVNGQYSNRNVSVLGGVAYGHQDYAGIKQSDATTFALGARYMFGEERQPTKTFVEVGGWLSPDQQITFSRSYMNGAATATGQGTTNSLAGGWYGRLGAAWDINLQNQLVGYGEFGQQLSSYDAYSEAFSATNPFPATVSSGDSQFYVARLGGSFTHIISYTPFTFTLFGAAAHSIDTQNNLQATIGGFGLTQAVGNDRTWGEYGFQLNAYITRELSVNVGLFGTTQEEDWETNLHGLAGLSYKF